MILQHDEIHEISEQRLRYFGGPGQMLCPCPATMASVVARIPRRKLATTDLLCKILAARFNVRGTCPVTARNSLKAAATQAAIPHWRVLKANGELTTLFPGGIAAQARQLEEEGFVIDSSGKAPRVRDFRAHLVTDLA